MDIPDPSTDFQGYQASLFKALTAATNATNAIPVEDLGFLRSLDRSLARDLDQSASALLSTANRLTTHCAKDIGLDAIQRTDDIDDVNDRFSSVVDVIDGLFERAVSRQNKQVVGRISQCLYIPLYSIGCMFG